MVSPEGGRLLLASAKVSTENEDGRGWDTLGSSDGPRWGRESAWAGTPLPSEPGKDLASQHVRPLRRTPFLTQSSLLQPKAPKKKGKKGKGKGKAPLIVDGLPPEDLSKEQVSGPARSWAGGCCLCPVLSGTCVCGPCGDQCALTLPSALCCSPCALLLRSPFPQSPQLQRSGAARIFKKTTRQTH